VFVTGGPSFNEIDPFLAQFLSGLPFAQDRDYILYNQRCRLRRAEAGLSRV
jgi:hypothetical protein